MSFVSAFSLVTVEFSSSTARLEAARRGVDALTARELRVAELAAGGYTNRRIAQTLFVTPRTVEHHLRSVYRKLAILSREHLTEILEGHVPTDD